jgi:hypothetical protein
MKSSIIRGVMIFAAGAGSAVVAGGGWWTPPETNPEEFAVRLQKVSRELAEIGVYAVSTRDGVVALDPNPAQCTPTPQPDIMEGRAVNPVLLNRGLGAVDAYNDGRIAGVKVGIIVRPPCKPE